MPPRHWQSHNWQAQALRPVSWLYAVVWHLRKRLYRWGWLKIHRLPVPVVVIGNVVTGGVGKTPITIALVQHLQKQGVAVGVVSRGYGRERQEGGKVRAVNAQSTATQVGDEPLLIHHKTKVPVVVGSDRVAAIRHLLATNPNCQVILSDDGLQHWSMGRDIEIVVFDERDTGNHFLLPAGPLREPWPRESQCQTTFVLRSPPRQLATDAQNASGETMPLDELRPLPLHTPTLHAIAGIAKPEQFFDMLRQAGLQLQSTQSFEDHDDLQSFALPTDASTNADATILCTEKDAVKLWPRFPHILAVPLHIELDVHFLQAFDACMGTLLANRNQASTTAKP